MAENYYIGKGYYSGSKGMDERGVFIETTYCSPIKKGTVINGSSGDGKECTNCAIEQNGRVLCASVKDEKKFWAYPIENLAPGIKAPFFGLGSYKNVAITGINKNGAIARVKSNAKSANGINCSFSEEVSVYLRTIDIKKFKTWYKEWAHQFGIKKQGNVWMTRAQWENFIFKIVFPTCIEKSLKTTNAPTNVGATFVMTKANAKVVYDEVAQMFKNYCKDSLGIDVGVYLG